MSDPSSFSLQNQAVTYVDVTTSTQQLASNIKYKADSASLVTFTLPAAPVLGDQVFIRGYGAGGWKLAQNAGQTIHGASNTTTGTGGYLASQTRFDCVTLECVIATTDWQIINQRGTLSTV